MITISSGDARKNFSEILGRVAYGRESFLITKKGRPMARLVPVPKSKLSRKRPKAKIAVSRKKRRNR
jgi:prevent-host-death family protein